MSKLFKISALVALLIILLVVTGHAQPPPPPPPGDTPPCWPPPCVPVDKGILFAICGAVLFGAATIWKSLRKRAVQ